MKKYYFILSFIYSTYALAQSDGKSLSFFSDVLGRTGVLVVVGILFFAYTYKNSIKFFGWIEDQTYGTRDYIMQKFEILHIEVEPVKVTYALLFCSIGFSILVFGVFAAFGLFLPGIILATLFSVIGWKAPRPIVDFMEKQRVKKYQAQMVDALNLLANGLRAGLSVPQALGMVVDELPAPVSQEFNLILQQSKIGVPLEEAFENLNKRVKTEDNEMFVTSVNILRETGGNLAEVFDTIVNVIRERFRLQQKIETYVAQGMFQGFVIFSMPFAQIAINGMNDPDYLGMMFTTPIGLIMFTAICGFSFLGLFVIMKIVDIKV
jgi:tight adherence protein B